MTVSFEAMVVEETGTGLGSMVRDDVMIGEPSRTSAMTVQVPVKDVSSGSAGFKRIPQDELPLDIQTDSERVLVKEVGKKKKIMMIHAPRWLKNGNSDGVQIGVKKERKKTLKQKISGWLVYIYIIL